jgi:hypothetical protein
VKLDRQFSNSTRNLPLVRQRSIEDFADDSPIITSEIGVATGKQRLQLISLRTLGMLDWTLTGF